MNEKFQTAERHFQSGDFQNALENFLSEFKTRQQDAWLLQRIAECYYKLDRFNDARTFAGKSIKLNDSLSIPHVILSYCAFRKGDIDESKLEAEKAYTLSPDTLDVLDNYGMALVATGDVDRGIEILRRALEINPNSYSLHNNVAIAHLIKKNYKKYLEESKKVYLLKPTLKNASKLLVAYHQRYAFWVTIVTVLCLFLAAIYKFHLLLVIPMYILMFGVWNVVQYIRSKLWKKAIFHLVINVLFAC